MNKRRKEAEVWNKGDKISIQRATGKETSRLIYIIKEIMSTNAIRLKLLTTIRIYLVVIID